MGLRWLTCLFCLAVLPLNACALGVDTSSQGGQQPPPSLVAHDSQSVVTQPQQDPAGGTVILRLQNDTQKSPQSNSAEMLKSFSELAGALAWPTVFVVLLVTQRRVLTQILSSLVDIIGKSTRLKLGELIDVEVDRSAKQAEQSPRPEREVPPQEREAAARIDKLVGGAELSVVRQRMLEFAREYEATRSNLKPGSARTRVMNAIVAKMRTLAIAARPFLAEFAKSDSSPGTRLAAIAILQLVPSLEYVSWLIDRMAVEQPFVFFHASLALLATVRSYGSRHEAELRPALERALDTVNSFKGGAPDLNTLETLKEALSDCSLWAVDSHPLASTVSFNPTALVTATSVESRGFPLADKARYRLSRSMPAALATLAMLPRASAMRRSAMRRTLGSSSSSKAARRYSAANSGFSRSSRTVASSWEMLALRFISFSPGSP